MISTSTAILLVSAIACQVPPQQPTAENVIIVTFDGFRPEDFFGGADKALIDKKAGGVPDVQDLTAKYWRETPEERREVLLPFIWGTIAKEGQIFGDRTKSGSAKLTNGMKFSFPGYNEMFCGFGDPRVDSNDKVSNPNLSVLEFLDEKPEFRGRVAAFCTWDVFPSIFRVDKNRLKVHAGWTPIEDEPLTPGQLRINALIGRLPHYWAGNAFDVIPIEASLEHLRRHQPRVLFVGLGETDEWAHHRRYDLYLDAAHAGDAFLAELWATVQSMPGYAGKTTLIITTDHGRGVTGDDWTSHGGKIDGAEHIWIAVIGAGTPALGVREGVDVTQSQVAATIAELLGEDFRGTSPKSAAPLPGVLVTSPAAR